MSQSVRRLFGLEVDGQGNINGSGKQNDEVAPPAASRVRVPAGPSGVAIEPMDAAAASRSAGLENSSADLKPLPGATALGDKPLAAPSVRRRVMEAAIELRSIEGSGPAGRITHEDVDHCIEHAQGTTGYRQRNANTSVKEYKIIGVRRKIAEHMSLSYSRIPHITIVEEVDVTILEELRTELNDAHAVTRARLTVLPFVMKAVVESVREQPAVNARYDDEAGRRFPLRLVYTSVLLRKLKMDCLCRLPGIVKLFPSGTMPVKYRGWQKPVVAISLGKEESGGSTITVSSLGAMGGIANNPYY